jgi:hypothetical protein
MHKFNKVFHVNLILTLFTFLYNLDKSLETFAKCHWKNKLCIIEAERSNQFLQPEKLFNGTVTHAQHRSSRAA